MKSCCKKLFKIRNVPFIFQKFDFFLYRRKKIDMKNEKVT